MLHLDGLSAPFLICDSDSVPDVAFLCSFFHVAGFSGSQPKRMPAVLVVCFVMSLVPMVPSVWCLLCGFSPPASSLASIFFFFSLHLGVGLLSFCVVLRLCLVLRIMRI